jgi:hypothetical protein
VTADRAPIFDDLERTEATPSEHGEPIFDFLNRVAGDYWAHPRQLMQAWADRIPDPPDYNNLRQRFRSHDDDQFRSAFLELYLHECLARAGYRVTIHPSLPATTRRPDFHAERSGMGFYLEAIAPGTSADAKAAAGRRAVLFDTVNRLGNLDFLLWLSELREGPRPPASARLREDLRRWLSQLDPDDFADLGTAPEHRWEQDGWAATFKPIPRRPDARGRRPQSTIGVYAHMGASVIDDAPAIRNALAAKHHAYGDLSAPFVVAVGTYIHDPDRWHSANALYGQEAIQIGETSDGETVRRVVRQRDGYFGVPDNWQHQNVSAVLLINQLMPYYFQKAENTLWRHPDPLHPLAADLGVPAATIDLDGSQLIETPAPVTAAEMFGLPDPWPPGERWA